MLEWASYSALTVEIYVKLLQCAHDSDEAARVSIASSLREIGAKQPIFALTQAIDFVRIKKVGVGVGGSFVIIAATCCLLSC